jgi:Co/Zn/Cd efflux system component
VQIEKNGNGIRHAVLTVALLNLSYFGVEFAVALFIGSVSLMADSVDFLEDASINMLIFFAVAWSARNRAKAGMALSLIVLVPGFAFLWTAIAKFLDPVPPEPFLLSLTGAGAFAVNLACAFILLGYRHGQGSLTRGAFLSARNDLAANVMIVIAGLITAYLWRSVWPDILVGFGIALMNLDAAREIWDAARNEHDETP